MLARLRGYSRVGSLHVRLLTVSSVTAWLGGLAMLVAGGCSALAPDTKENDCANLVCPDRIVCAPGKALVVLEGACCPSCETSAVNAGDGCPCSPEHDPVCGEDHVLYQNACFARCAGVDVVETGACRSHEQFPAGNYGEPCDGDDACDAPYECLPAAHDVRLDPSRTFCATRCETVDDCPPVVSDHCGDQTLCTDGVCGFFLCI